MLKAYIYFIVLTINSFIPPITKATPEGFSKSSKQRFIPITIKTTTFKSPQTSIKLLRTKSSL